MYKLFVSLILLTSCSFAPSYDPNINAKMAEIKTNAIDLKASCKTITVSDIHNRLVIPALMLESMSVYRNEYVSKAGLDVWKESVAFEQRAAKQVSVAYCNDKLDDIQLTISAIMKPYGTTE